MNWHNASKTLSVRGLDQKLGEIKSNTDILVKTIEHLDITKCHHYHLIFCFSTLIQVINTTKPTHVSTCAYTPSLYDESMSTVNIDLVLKTYRCNWDVCAIPYGMVVIKKTDSFRKFSLDLVHIPVTAHFCYDSSLYRPVVCKWRVIMV